MEIRILHGVEGARSASGIAVVIDVFRAFSVAAYAFNAGVAEILPVGTVEEALKLKQDHPDYLVAGERHERKVPGFDFGNSPSQILKGKLAGKTLVHTTSAGTRGLVNVINTSHILTGSFVNADAIVRYIQKEKPEQVSLVCMGYGAEYPVEEDNFCAEYIKGRLLGKEPDFHNYVKIIRESSGMRFFIEENQEFAPREDFDLCLNLNRFNFVLKAIKKDGHLQLEKISV